ncbi:MAG: MarR family winged helix-turn-helix transcriptional regulator [Candidatus Hadarchaeum sp.]|uniref:MarR family winged helix-turn-helix transcriptional regulator n=1 Tax=Candidatus Hadarchaeum sp. TaxID=2883567 RepID=UPI003D105597
MDELKSIGRLISYLHRLKGSYLHERLGKYGIGSGQVPLLMRLYRGDGINQDHLAHEVNIDKATCTRAIEKLERVGLVRRRTDEADRRAYRVCLTKKAKRLRPTVERTLKDWTKLLLTGFSAEEREKLFEFLERLIANASAKKNSGGEDV